MHVETNMLRLECRELSFPTRQHPDNDQPTLEVLLEDVRKEQLPVYSETVRR